MNIKLPIKPDFPEHFVSAIKKLGPSKNEIDFSDSSQHQKAFAHEKQSRTFIKDLIVTSNEKLLKDGTLDEI